MNVSFRRYKLSPKRALNRLSSSQVKEGVQLRVNMRWSSHFADYFPHEALGDMPVELFLEMFKYQGHEYEQKVFYFLLNDERLRSQKIKPFLNHQIWNGEEEITSKVIKYKLQGIDDYTFIRALKNKIRVRLDANGLFERETLARFEKEIHGDLLPLVDYLEDPMKEQDWGHHLLPMARDFIKGEPYSVLIHKPNARFLKETEKKVIFSSYMGSDLGRWHAYCELLEKGDLSEYHGILTPGYYEDECLGPMGQARVEKMYQDLHLCEWKLLCSI